MQRLLGLEVIRRSDCLKGNHVRRSLLLLRPSVGYATDRPNPWGQWFVPYMRSHAGISRNREFPTHPCTKLWQPFWPCPPLISVLRRWGGSSFIASVRTPSSAFPPRYWRCRALPVLATLVLPASNPREPRLPRSLCFSLGSNRGFAEFWWVVTRPFGVPCPLLPAGFRLVVLCLVPRGNPHARGAI